MESEQQPMRVNANNNNTLHVVNVSGGAASAVALFRVIERHGIANIIVRFADVGSEDNDLYRFLDDLERVSGVPIIRLKDGRSTWDVFEERGMWTSPSNGGCVASYFLKKQVLRNHLEAMCADPQSTIIYVGFDASEDDRCERITKAAAPWKVDFPLRWKPYLLRCDQESFLRSRGIEPCSMYGRGYSHANCGGACVLAGIQQWAMVLKDYPERYAKAEQHEQRMMQRMNDTGRVVQSILRSRVGRTSRNLTLTELRQSIERGERKDGDDYRLGSCSCIGLLFDAEAW